MDGPEVAGCDSCNHYGKIWYTLLVVSRNSSPLHSLSILSLDPYRNHANPYWISVETARVSNVFSFSVQRVIVNYCILP